MYSILSSGKASAGIVTALALLLLPIPATQAVPPGPPVKPGYDRCIGPGSQGGNTTPGVRTCFKTNASFSSQSTELFPSRCDGQLGFWIVVPMPNGATYCVARSIADFYHNGTDTSTCLIDKFEGNSNNKLSSTTASGACP